MRDEQVLGVVASTRFAGTVSSAEGHMARGSNEVMTRNFLYKLLVVIAVGGTLGVGIFATAYPHKLLFQIGLGLLFAHSTELVHQCLHRTATGNAKWDHLCGRILGWPSGTSFWYYCWFHLWHHKYNGTGRDQESFGYTYRLMEAPHRSTRLAGFLRHLSMAGHYSNTLRRMALALRGRLAREMLKTTPEMNRSVARKIEQDYLIMLSMLGCGLILSLTLHTLLLFDLWLLPLLIAWGPAHALIELPEHWGCERPNANVFLNTRSIGACWLTRWYTNNNCNHVGHHHDMTIPMGRLPAYEKQLMRSKTFSYYENSYADFYLEFLASLWRGGRRTYGG
jgi:fatty acid desaturase